MEWAHARTTLLLNSLYLILFANSKIVVLVHVFSSGHCFNCIWIVIECQLSNILVISFFFILFDFFFCVSFMFIFILFVRFFDFDTLPNRFDSIDIGEYFICFALPIFGQIVVLSNAAHTQNEHTLCAIGGQW